MGPTLLEAGVDVKADWVPRDHDLCELRGYDTHIS